MLLKLNCDIGILIIPNILTQKMTQKTDYITLQRKEIIPIKIKSYLSTWIKIININDYFLENQSEYINTNYDAKEWLYNIVKK